MGQKRNIKRVNVLTRSDGAYNENYYVSIGDSADPLQNPKCSNGIIAGVKTNFQCYLTGRFLAVWRKGINNHFSLCEVEAFETY